MRLDFPAGWSGTVRLPLLLAAVYGSGDILVDGVPIGGDAYEVTANYQDIAVAPQIVEVRASTTAVSIVLLVNPMRFSMGTLNEIRVTGRDMFALEVSSSSAVPSAIFDPGSIDGLRKPVP